ncbi:hypothetical protein FB45DRAFT_917998 [Roridomyces roridus]|uniref:Uncharacterized protein n=1 Tax=Roridomyces roridus TaxID=1738132 RepID=A0AAD7BQS1_9AGAR|nr:hypothetical protein FB45DRAFT_917998 [Roridomyces roridus]
MQKTCTYWERKMPPTPVMRNWPIEGKPHAGAGEQPGTRIASVTTSSCRHPTRERPCGERSLERLVLTRCAEQGCRRQPHSRRNSKVQRTYGIGHDTGGTYTRRIAESGGTRKAQKGVDGSVGGKGRVRKEGKTAHLVVRVRSTASETHPVCHAQTVNVPRRRGHK